MTYELCINPEGTSLMHRWTRWGKPQKITTGEIGKFFQQRECVECGMVEQQLVDLPLGVYIE